MSLGYAEKLSYREDLGGQLGAREHFETGSELKKKIDLLASMVNVQFQIPTRQQWFIHC